MTEDDDNFTRAVVEWKHKHRIRDDDPMLASLELLELFFQNVRIQIPDSSSATIVEVRAAIQQLDRLVKDFAKQTRELTVEIRRASHSGKAAHQATGVWFVAIACLLAGFLAGKLVPWL
jgi:thermostable 8-oxoguanine DNA glycosylase